MSLFGTSSGESTLQAMHWDPHKVKHTSTSVVYWPCPNRDMPADIQLRALWFLNQLVASFDTQPGAFITPKIFIPNSVWSTHIDSLCARQISVRAAFLMSVARSMQEIQLTPKLAAALKRKIGELWEQKLNVDARVPSGIASSPQSQQYSPHKYGPPSPPILGIDHFPGPIRLRRGPRAHLKSLMGRRSASPDRTPNDLLYQYSPPKALKKYAEAIDALVHAYRKSTVAWVDFLIYELTSHIADDILDVHERYLENVKFAFLG